ncbi:MAG: TnpV protein [Clostridia bacterium]|nr:TnpV protein [Clostridia bacterium]
MKSYFEEQGGTYTRVGGFLIPDLVLDEQPEGWIGKYGIMRQEYLKMWKKSLYNDLLLSGKLKQHLLDINRDAQEEFETIVRQTAKAEGVTEELKKQDQMEWVRRMNNIRNRAEAFVKHDLIYS